LLRGRSVCDDVASAMARAWRTVIGGNPCRGDAAGYRTAVRARRRAPAREPMCSLVAASHARRGRPAGHGLHRIRQSGLDVHLAKDLGMRPAVRRRSGMGCMPPFLGWRWPRLCHRAAPTGCAGLHGAAVPACAAAPPRHPANRCARTVRHAPAPPRAGPSQIVGEGSTSSPWKRLPTSAQRRT
jgi:hypothetical protein